MYLFSQVVWEQYMCHTVYFFLGLFGSNASFSAPFFVVVERSNVSYGMPFFLGYLKAMCVIECVFLCGLFWKQCAIQYASNTGLFRNSVTQCAFSLGLFGSNMLYMAVPVLRVV